MTEDRKPGPIHTIEVSRPLDAGEEHELGKRVARMGVEIMAAESKLKKESKVARAEIAAMKEDLGDLCTVLDRGFSVEHVEAFLEVDYDAKKRVWRCPQTGEVLKDGPLMPEDRQIGLGF